MTWRQAARARVSAERLQTCHLAGLARVLSGLTLAGRMRPRQA